MGIASIRVVCQGVSPGVAWAFHHVWHIGAAILVMTLTACVGVGQPVPSQQRSQSSPTEVAQQPQSDQVASPESSKVHPPQKSSAPLPLPAPSGGAVQPSRAEGEEKDSVLVTEPVVVQERRMPHQGTGAIGLQEQSDGSSRLGLTTREIPASIDVITQQTMQERGQRTVAEAMESATGVTVGEVFGVSTFSMRGFTANQIRVLYDGLNVGPRGFVVRPRDSWNLDRIEILKGPASVLYGEGATGGVINLVTKRPKRLASQTEFFLSYGSYNTIRAGIGREGTLGTDKLHYRVDLSYQNADNTLGITRTPYTFYNLTTGLLYDVTPRFNLELSFDASYDRADLYYGTPLVPSSFAAQGIGDVVTTTDNRTIDLRMLRQNYNVQNSEMNALTTWSKLKAAWQPTDFMELRNQTYYYTANRDWMNSETYTFNTATQLIDRDLFLVQHDQFVVGDRFEWQINHPIGRFPNRFVTGVDFTYTNFTRPSFYSANGGGSVDPFAPVAGLFVLGPLATQKVSLTDTAVFAEDQLSVTKDLKVIAGMRSDWIDLKRDFFTTTGALDTAASFEQSLNPTTWRAGATYDVLRQVTLYGQYATAADTVGSSLFTQNRFQSQFALAPGHQWEVGAKGSFWNNRVEWTIAYFDIVRKNILTQVSQTESVNVGRQSSHGIEFDGAVRLTDAWRIQGNVTFLSARYDRFSQLVSGNVVSRDGKRVFEVPQTVWNLWTIYRVPVPIPFDLGVAWRFVGDRYNNTANTVRLHSYMTMDAWVSVPYKQFWLTLRGRNLFDETYAVWGSNFYPNQVMIGAPRTVEFSVMARF